MSVVTRWMVVVGVLLTSPWVDAASPPRKAGRAVQTQTQMQMQMQMQMQGARAAEAPVGDPVMGKEKAESERCMECHGEDGQGAGHGNGPEGKFAKLAGQHPAYVLKQLRDFRTGARKHDQMTIMARSISDEDVRDIAAYFAGLPPMKPDGLAQGEARTRGQQLFERADAARGVPSCASCHGAKGEGMPAQPLVPVIGGQEWRYLDKQLRDWRSGDRKNAPDGVMAQATQGLSDKDIENLATYLSGM